MSIDHNRIKVADLEKNDPDKILITNQNGELEFSDLNNIQKDNYNALDYTSEGKALDARQGKVLKELIDNISSETTTTIEKSTIIDNDKIIINDSETSFLKKSVKFLNVKAALKTYFDTIYQSFMGIVTVSEHTYQLLISDNGKKIMFTSARAVSLTVPTDAVVALPIGARIKIVQQGDGIVILSTTGLTIVSSSPLYTIKGQTITLEKTAVNTWTIEGNNLNGEVRLPAYPNTRNDGQINNNKVLGTDANGNLRMFTIATNPAPYIRKLIPDSSLPDTTGNIKILGDFFTPAMCDRIENPNAIIIGGVAVIHYATFINSQEILVNVTTGSIEGSFSATLDNGLSTKRENALIIVLGTIFKPKSSEWINKSSQLDVSQEGNALISVIDTYQSGTWNKQFNAAIDYSVRFRIKKSPLGTRYKAEEPPRHLSLLKISDDSPLFYFTLNQENINASKLFGQSVSNIPSYYNVFQYYGAAESSAFWNSIEENVVEYRFISGVMYLYYNNILKYSYRDVVNENLRLKVSLNYFDIIDIQYIELAT